MSKRNGYPKPSASERTLFRYRVNHGIETANDKLRIKAKFERNGDLQKLRDSLSPAERKRLVVEN